MIRQDRNDTEQEEVSLVYFHHLNDVLRCKIAIVKNRINLYILPDWFAVDVDPETGEFSNDRYYVTANKKWYEANKHREPSPQLMSYSEIQRFIKAQIRYDEQRLEELDRVYEEELSRNSGYEPEPLEVIKEKYNLTSDYINESMKSSWDGYVKNVEKLESLEKILAGLDDPLSREDVLHRMRPRYTPTQTTDEDLYDEAVSMIARTQIASTSYLQHHLSIGYTKATMIMKRLEDNGIIGSGDGIHKRPIFINEDGSKREGI